MLRDGSGCPDVRLSARLSPMRVEEILAWYQSKRSDLIGSEVSVVDIGKRDENVPAAFADFSGPDTMGRINGWLSGEFDFEAVQVSDGKDLYWGHKKIWAVHELV